MLSTVAAASVLVAWSVPSVHTQAASPNPIKVDELKMGLRTLYVDHIF